MSGQYPSNTEVRAWAEQRKPGVVPAKGAIPRFLVIAWNRAHPDRPYVKSQAYHGTNSGYTSHGCRCDDCKEAGARYSRESYALRTAERDEDMADQFGGAS